MEGRRTAEINQAALKRFFAKLAVIIQGMLNKSDYVCSKYDMTYEELLVLPQLKTRSLQHNFCYHPTKKTCHENHVC